MGYSFQSNEYLVGVECPTQLKVNGAINYSLSKWVQGETLVEPQRIEPLQALMISILKPVIF